MAKVYRATLFVRMGNLLATTPVRAGLTVWVISLLTVRGRKSGQPRRTPVAVVELNGKRYLVAAFGVVNWVCNLRAAGEATLTRNHRSEAIIVVELSPEEAAPILKACLGSAAFARSYFDVTPASPLEDFVREAANHPVFRVQRVAEMQQEAISGNRTMHR